MLLQPLAVIGGSETGPSAPASAPRQYDPDAIFEPGVTFDNISKLYSLPPEPRDMAMGDLNDDGYPDVAVVFNGSYIYIFNGTSSGLLNNIPWNISLAAKSISDVRSIAIGDLNGDSKDDIAISYALPNPRVGILFQDSVFSTAAGIELIATGSPQQLVIGDFSNDGKNDIAVVLNRSGTDQIYMFRDPFDGSLDNSRSININGLDDSAFLSAGFINNDARLDLLVAGRTGEMISWYAQPFGPEWSSLVWTETTIEVPGGIAHIGLIDLDDLPGDEIVSINAIDERVEIRYNNGNGAFTAQKNIGSSHGLSSFAFGDLTDDGHKDMVLVNEEGSNCSMFYRTSATWGDKADKVFPLPRSPISSIIRGAELTLPGLYVLSKGGQGESASLTFYIRQEGGASNSEEDVMLTDGAFGAMVSGPLTGHRDVIAILLPSANQLLLYDRTTGQKRIHGTGDAPSAIALGDFNGDGAIDIAVAEGVHAIRVFDGSADMFEGMPGQAVFDTGMTEIFSIAAGGAGRGADKDILALGGVGGVVIVYDALDDDARVLERISTPSAGAVSSLVIGNFFTDGVGGDIAALNTSSGKIEIYEHKPASVHNSNYNASFALHSGSNMGLAIITGDFNDDGYQDLAMACSSGKILIYLQTDMNQGFYSNDSYDITVTTSFPPSQLASGDLNDDGLDDIVVSWGDLPLASAYLSKGDRFVHAFDLTTGCVATGLVVGDLNGDGRDDVAASSAGSRSLSMWFQNNLAPVAVAINPDSVDEGVIIEFDGSSSMDSFSDREHLLFLWRFGDGSDSDQKIATHTYASDGIYHASLTVTDRGGLSNTTHFTITVLDTEPTADFTFSPSEIWEGEPVQFTDASLHHDDIASWRWDFGDGDTSEAQHPVHIFTANGTYSVKLTIKEADGDISEKTVPIVILDRGPEAAIDVAASVPEGEALPIRSASSSYDPIISWEWSFGDGTTGSGEVVSHTYAQNGTYTITLTVREADGDVSTTSVTIEVTDKAPMVDFQMSSGEVPEGTSVSFTDLTSSYDGIVSRHWNFGDGTTSTSHNPVHLYTIPGDQAVTYTVTLTVMDGDGSSSMRSKTVTVMPTSPHIVSLEAGGSLIFNEDEGINFTVVAQRTGLDITKYAWDFDYDESKGFSPAPGKTMAQVYYEYSEAREYVVCVRVYDKNSYSQMTLKITIRNMAPSAELSYVISGGNVVDFDATRSSDTPSDKPGLMFRWNFGEGTGWTAWSSNMTPRHEFTIDGVYTVTVEVKDDNGATASKSVSVRIDRTPPEISHDGAPPTTAFSGEEMAVRVNVTDLSSIKTVTLHYTIGNKTYSLPMTRLSGTNVYMATIPALNATGALSYYVEATDGNGHRSETGVVTVSVMSPPDNGPLIILALASVAVLLGALLYVRSFRMVIDEVFVIYRDGNLIAHQTRRLKPGMDDQVLGSMLAAVQSFVRDSFKDETSTALNRLDFGEKKLLVERGEYLIVAAVLHGNREGRAPQRLREVLSRAENRFADALKDWDGDLDSLRGIKDVASDAFRFRIAESSDAPSDDAAGKE